METRGDLAVLVSEEETAVNVDLLQLHHVDGTLQIGRHELVIVVERFVKLGIALRHGLTVEPAAMLDVGLEPGADEGQPVTLRERFSEGPGTVDEELHLKFPVSLRGETGDGIVELGEVGPLVNAQADGDTGFGMEKRRSRHLGEEMAVGRGVVRPEREIRGRGEAVHAGKRRGLEEGTMGVLRELFRISVPVDDVAVVAVLHEIGDAAGLRDDDWNSAAESLGGGEEITLFFTVPEENVASVETVAVVERIKIEWTNVEAIRHAELHGEGLDLGEGFSLGALGVFKSGSFGTGPGADDHAGLGLEEVGQAHDPL